MLAKVKGAGVQGKRKRGDDDEMDVDMDGEGDEAPELMEGGEEWMDVDGEQQAPRKKTKTNEGRVVAKREPRSNRSLAGMRDDVVRFLTFPLLFSRVLLCFLPCYCLLCTDFFFSLFSLGCSASFKSGQAAEPWAEGTQYAGQGRRGRSYDQNENGMSSVPFHHLSFDFNASTTH